MTAGSPREMVRGLVRGQVARRPLFIPLVFSLAAKLEDVPLQAFLTDPTKLTNALAAVHRHLRTDGVVAYLDATLEAEALGCQFEWSTGVPTMTDRPSDPSSVSIHELETKGRVPVALEVVRRLRVMLRDEPALLVGLTGPVTLAQYLAGDDVVERLEDGADEAAFVEDLAAGLLVLARAFCQAGADVIVVTEQALPEAIVDFWQWEVSSVWNVIRFHEALPVVFYGGGVVPSEPLDGSPFLCLAPDTAAVASLPDETFAVALPSTEQLPTNVERWTRADRCALVTTAGEIPYRIDIQTLERIVDAMRAVLPRAHE